MSLHIFLLKIFYSILLIIIISSNSLTVLAAGEEKKDDESKRQSFCPKGLSFFINGEILEEHEHYRTWMRNLSQLSDLLKQSGRNPIVFISHAWHRHYYENHKNETSNPLATLFVHETEVDYYDQLTLYLARMLQVAGFNFVYDHYMDDLEKNMNALGPEKFMQGHVATADVVISMCTPLYHYRSYHDSGSGVYQEVEAIKQRMETGHTQDFYIPLLVHAAHSDYHREDKGISNLLPKEIHPYHVTYLDWQDKKTFLSNMWQVLYRLFDTVRRKSKDSGVDQAYVKVLGKLLPIDYYGQTEVSIKLKNDHNTLRIFTTPIQELDSGEIVDLIHGEIEKQQELFGVTKNQDIAVFLGNTGAGKSTFINFLAGKKLKVDSSGQEYELDEDDPMYPTAMKIGTGADSMTRYPQWIEANTGINKLLLFDLPGFNDTGGTLYSLMNSAFIHQVINDAGSVRFVFVAGQGDFTDNRGEKIKPLFHKMKNMTAANDHSLFIVTKSQFSLEEQEKQKLETFLQKKLQSHFDPHLQRFLDPWKTTNRFWHVPHPRVRNMSESRDEVVRAYQQSLLDSLLKLQGADQKARKSFRVNQFYSPAANYQLKDMFLREIRAAFDHDRKELEGKLAYISTYDSVIQHYQTLTFEVFEGFLNTKVYSIVLLKDVCGEPYESALEEFKKEYDQKRKEHTEFLTAQKENRKKWIQEETTKRSEAIIQSFSPHSPKGLISKTFIPYEYAYFYDQVCGEGSIHQITNDSEEKNIARQSYAGWIGDHSYQQMMTWHEGNIIPNMNELSNHLNRVTEDNRRLSESLNQVTTENQTLSSRLDEVITENQTLSEQLTEVTTANKTLTSRFEVLVKQVEGLLHPPLLPSSAPVPATELAVKGPSASVSPARVLQSIPEIARGYEEIYRRFIKGRLVYRSDPKSDVGLKEFLFSQFENPLSGEFNLSGLEFTDYDGQKKPVEEYLRIKIGCRETKENESKTTVWIVPKFVVDQSNNPWRSVSWSSDVGIFWTWGNYELKDFDYLTMKQFDEISSKNLYDLRPARSAAGGWRRAGAGAVGAGVGCGAVHGAGGGGCAPKFYLYF